VSSGRNDYSVWCARIAGFEARRQYISPTFSFLNIDLRFLWGGGDSDYDLLECDTVVFTKLYGVTYKKNW
jgi:hypothetical protein